MSRNHNEASATLTRRQRQVAHFLCRTGLTYKQIAAQLDICEGTMRKHAENLYRRLGVHSRAELTMVMASERNAVLR